MTAASVVTGYLLAGVYRCLAGWAGPILVAVAGRGAVGVVTDAAVVTEVIVAGVTLVVVVIVVAIPVVRMGYIACDTCPAGWASATDGALVIRALATIATRIWLTV